jgi:hypothetical protein
MINDQLLPPMPEFNSVTMKTEDSKKSPKAVPCPEGSIEIGPFYVKPKVVWQIVTHGLGCYANSFNHVSLVLEAPTHKNGIPILAADRLVGKDYCPRYMEDTDRRAISALLGASILGENTNVSSMAKYEDKLPLFKKLFKMGMDNQWDLFRAHFGMSGMVLFGDVAVANVSQYVTQWMAWYLRERGEGVLSSTHGVINPNYPSGARLCQIWAWTPPANEMLTTSVGHSMNTLVRSEKDLKHSIKKRWPTAQGEYYPVLKEICPLPVEDDRELKTILDV